MVPFLRFGEIVSEESETQVNVGDQFEVVKLVFHLKRSESHDLGQFAHGGVYCGVIGGQEVGESGDVFGIEIGKVFR